MKTLFPVPDTARHATGEDTRARLIEAATEVFAAEGFRAARVQAIAQRAEQRLSAINYHFGSKEGLYLAVMQHNAGAALASAPLTPPHEGLPLRARFEFAIHAFATRLLAPHGTTRIGALMVRELMNPTPVLDIIIQNVMTPQSLIFLGLLREIVGPKPPDVVLRRCMISIFGQCAVYMTATPMISRVAPATLKGDLTVEVAQHVATFSWGGLLAIREKWEGGDAKV